MEDKFIVEICSKLCDKMALEERNIAFKYLPEDEQKRVEMIVGLQMLTMVGEVVFKNLLNNIDKKVQVNLNEIDKALRSLT